MNQPTSDLRTLRYNIDFGEVQTIGPADFRIVAKMSDELTEDEQQQLGTQFATSGDMLNRLIELQEWYSDCGHCFQELPDVLSDLMSRVDTVLRANGRTPQMPIWETDQQYATRRRKERRMVKKAVQDA